MKRRVLLFASIYAYFLFIFAIQKIIFMLAVAPAKISFTDILNVLYHGLPLDLSMSAYLCILPAVLLVSSIWTKPKLICYIFNSYYALVISLIGIVCIADIVLYPYWGFHFDASVFLYLQKPKEAFASASGVEIVLGIVSTIAFIAITYFGYMYLIGRQIHLLKVPKSIVRTATPLVLLTLLLFLPIRGGVTVSTMNIGRVYFSEDMFLNHAAINPQFNLLYSFFKSEDFASQYQFYPKEEAENIFLALNKQSLNDSTLQLLTTDRPNIILVILESFSANVVHELGGEKNVTPNLSQFAKEGILFNNFYANSFRTDRGLVSILSGYPAHPTVAIMKYPQKTESLPTIPKSLREVGYDLSFYYGGDVDFANMRSYFVGACSISNVYSDTSFPLAERLTKWGVPDKFVLDRVYSDLSKRKDTRPFFTTVLSLSSHEPFDVPTKIFDVPFLNAVAYTDSCLGVFVERLKATSLWNNTLLVLVADHAIQSYPSELNNSDQQRFHIPMIWLGGALKQPMLVSDYGSQNDIAASLLSQLHVKHEVFNFSKDMLNKGNSKFAFYSYNNGFSLLDSTGCVLYDNDKQSVLSQTGDRGLEKKAKAFFQSMYLDLGTR